MRPAIDMRTPEGRRGLSQRLAARSRERARLELDRAIDFDRTIRHPEIRERRERGER